MAVCTRFCTGGVPVAAGCTSCRSTQRRLTPSPLGTRGCATTPTRYSYSGRPFVRKCQAHFGWNWGPGFITQGVHRPVCLVVVARGGATIDSVLVRQTAVSDANGSRASYGAGKIEGRQRDGEATRWPPVPIDPPSAVVLSLSVDVRCPPALSEPVDFVIAATLAGSPIGKVARVRCAAAAAPPSSPSMSSPPSSPPAPAPPRVVAADIDATVAVSPTATEHDEQMLPLWYPAGHGSQPLHNLTVTLCRADDASRCAAAWTSALGLREIELIQDPLPWTNRVNESLGPSRSFYFRVNGVPVCVAFAAHAWSALRTRRAEFTQH